MKKQKNIVRQFGGELARQQIKGQYFNKRAKRVMLILQE